MTAFIAAVVALVGIAFAGMGALSALAVLREQEGDDTLGMIGCAALLAIIGAVLIAAAWKIGTSGG